MVNQGKPAERPGNRQAAYSARNRAALIKSAHEVLAEVGPSATIEQISTHAQVSPTTIYKYFENKEILFAEALDQLWREWTIWSHNGAAPEESFEAFIDTARKLFWLKQTHPLFARILKNTLRDPTFVINAVKQGGVEVLKSLSDRGLIDKTNFEKRITLMSYALSGVLIGIYVTEELSTAEADATLAISLSIWGISESKAKKIISRPLIFAPVE